MFIKKKKESRDNSSLEHTPKSSDISFDAPRPKKVKTGNVQQNYSLALNDTSKQLDSAFSNSSSYLEFDSNEDVIDSQCSSQMLSLKYNQDPSLDSKQDDYRRKYFEIEISQANSSILTQEEQNEKNEGTTAQDYIIFKLKDITKMIKHQQRFSDQLYQDVIENNYSHEQMTPMGPIIAFSNILKKTLVELYAQKMKIPIEKTLGNLQYMNTILKKLVSNS